MAPIKTYTAGIPESRLVQLRQKLEASGFPNELHESGWDHGAPLADVKELVAYWRDRFDWRKQEAKINELPNFTTSINVDGFEPLDIHSLHQRSPVDEAIPLLFSHGWPGSFLEVTKLLPLLRFGGKGVPAFHVVAPSLPNYGFSSGPRKKGFGLGQYAETCHSLMLSLGYDNNPRRRLGLHDNPHHGPPLSSARASLPRQHDPRPLTEKSPPIPCSTSNTPSRLTTRGRKPAASGQPRTSRKALATAPSNQPNRKTLGYALSDSPVGLLAWIDEKLHDWTDAYPWSPDEILTWVSIYWFSTAGPAASLRIYYESLRVIHRGLGERGRSCGSRLCRWGWRIFRRRSRWCRGVGGGRRVPVVFESVHDMGGHFAAWDRPEAIVDDLRKMFGRGGGAYGVVEGRDGYEKARARL